MNTFRFAYVTKRGVNHVLHRIGEMQIHASVTIEGRDDSELPEQAIACGRIEHLDLVKLASEGPLKVDE